jgi:cell wall-associated NlpC family hydrolase
MSNTSRPAVLRNGSQLGKSLILGAIFSSCFAVTAFAQTGVVNSDNVYIRTDSSPDSSVYGFINAGQEVTITSLEGDYYKVTLQGMDHLYINTEFIDLDDGDVTAPTETYTAAVDSSADDINASANSRYAVVDASSGLHLRSDASTDADVLLTLPDGAAVDVIDSWDNWTKVSYNGVVGFMKTQYVDLHTGKKPKQSYNSQGASVVAYAEQFIGTPYVWGGTNLNRGVDCSGLVYSVYKHFGIDLNRTSSGMASNGVRVTKDNLQPGDIVLFDTSGRNNGSISHAGIYIGDGKFIESSSGRAHGVTISSLSSDYYLRTYVTARRVL